MPDWRGCRCIHMLSSAASMECRSRVTGAPSLASSEKHGLQWYNTLKSSRAKPLHRPAVKSAKQRQGMVWYGSLSQKKPALSV